MFKVIVTILLFSSLAAASQNSKIEFHSFIGKNLGNTIYLKDIADFKNIDIKIALKLKNIKVDSFPSENTQKTYSDKFISGLLRPYSKVFKKNKIQLVIPKKIEVSNKFRISKKLVKEKVKKILQKNCIDCKVDISKLVMPLILNSKKIESWEIKNTQAKIRGHFSLPLKVNFKDSSRVLWIKGLAKILRKTPVANRPVHLGSRISKSDVSMEYRDMTYNPNQQLTLEYVVGKKVNRNLNKGQAIWQGYISFEKALRRGDIVNVKLGNASWSILVKARAEQGGVIGDRVSLRNLKTKKIINGLITGAGEVTVK